MRSIEADLIIALHEGIFEQPLWTTFLERLRRATGALYAVLSFRPIGQEEPVELYAGAQPHPDLQTLFKERYGARLLPYRQMREGRVYSLDEMLDASAPDPSGGKDALALLGITSLRMVRVTEPSGIDAWLSCTGGRGVGSASGALLATLVPHLRTALRSFISLERERFQAAVTADAIQRLNFGWLTLDAQCRILDTTPHVEQIFQRSGVLRRGRYDRLTPSSPALDRELTALMKHFALDADSRPRAINLSRDPWMDMLVVPFQNQALSAGSRPVAIAYLSGDRRSSADRVEQLVDLFGLLPSEARLAWAMAQGLSITEAAEELGLTVETARNYSQKIYAKTGARGQSELVRNILTSVLAFA